MARRRPPVEQPAAEPAVLVCRGGDCGSARKHPGIDHRAQLERIRTALRDGTRVVPTACLDACDHSNVIVAVPGGDADAEPVWIGEVNDDAATERLLEWHAQFAAHGADAPPPFDAFQPSRAQRRELDEALERR